MGLIPIQFPGHRYDRALVRTFVLLLCFSALLPQTVLADDGGKCRPLAVTSWLLMPSQSNSMSPQSILQNITEHGFQTQSNRSWGFSQSVLWGLFEVPASDQTDWALVSKEVRTGRLDLFRIVEAIPETVASTGYYF